MGLLIGLPFLPLLGRAQNPSPTVTTLYSFTNQNGDGSDAGAGVIMGPHGALYGTTRTGGKPGGGGSCGIVFELMPPQDDGAWMERVIHSFGLQREDGCVPVADLTFGPNGSLFGTTLFGGSENLGTIFELKRLGAAGGTESILYSFMGQNANDGAYPQGSLSFSSNGEIFGATSIGGIVNSSCGPSQDGCGTVFKLTPLAAGEGWTETVLYRFTGENGDGYYPTSAVTIGLDGALYGTTEYGGAAPSCGTVFQLRPPTAPGGIWTETVLHTFQRQPDGCNPVAGLIASKTGRLYGATPWGGASGAGTVFELKPPAAPGGTWEETILYAFTGPFNGDGSSPYSALTFGENDALYGTALLGGLDYCCGTVFELKPPAAPGGGWSETTYALTSSDRESPYGTLAFAKGSTLFGTTSAGGASYQGTVFQITF